MFTRLARLIVFFAAVQILGGHWLALQSVAWIGMVANYSQGETLMVALESTFDGQHPCALCKVVKSGRAQERQQPAVKVIVKLDAVLEDVMQMPDLLETACQYLAVVRASAARTLAPPTPPPQVA